MQRITQDDRQVAGWRALLASLAPFAKRVIHAADTIGIRGRGGLPLHFERGLVVQGDERHHAQAGEQQALLCGSGVGVQTSSLQSVFQREWWLKLWMFDTLVCAMSIA